MLNIVVVEDDPRHLARLRDVLGGVSDFRLAGIHDSAEAALAVTDWKQVQVLLTDIELPGLSGVGLIAKVADENPAILSLAYTIHDQRETVFAALRAGAFGYVLKGGTAAELLDAIRRVARGESPISPGVARYLIDTFHHSPPSGAEDDSSRLTSREVDLLRLVADGFVYKEIGHRLGISPHTVHAHVKNIYEKLHAANRSQALRRAQALGYLGHKAKPPESGPPS